MDVEVPGKKDETKKKRERRDRQIAAIRDMFQEATAYLQAREARTEVDLCILTGDYRFRVKASNKDGVWNERGASLAVSTQSLA